MELRIDLSGLPVNDLADVLREIANALARFSGPRMARWGLAPLYESGVRVQADPEHGSGIERFRLPYQVAANRWGDCDGLAVYRISELLSRGRPASCRIDWVGHEMHARVRTGPQTIEDPWKIMEWRNAARKH